MVLVCPGQREEERAVLKGERAGSHERRRSKAGQCGVTKDGRHRGLWAVGMCTAGNDPAGHWLRSLAREEAEEEEERDEEREDVDGER